jgi:hypothetical protein
MGSERAMHLSMSTEHQPALRAEIHPDRREHPKARPIRPWLGENPRHTVTQLMRMQTRTSRVPWQRVLENMKVMGNCQSQWSNLFMPSRFVTLKLEMAHSYSNVVSLATDDT